MKTAMGNGVSALLSFQKAMSVESHNVANTKSTSYKADKVSFADMFYSQSIGLGVSMNTPVKDFSQGSLLPTNHEYDFAIDGEGFFQMKDPLNPEQTFYSRAGKFKSDKTNHLVDSNGMQVLGMVPKVTGDVITSEHTKNIASRVINVDGKITTFNIYSTNYQASAIAKGATGESGNNFKNVDANLNDIEELIYAYNNALKLYSITPEAGDPAQVTKAQSVIEFSKVRGEGNLYTPEVLINGIKIQQNFEGSVENTLKEFSNKINQLAGITSSVDVTTGELTVTSMIPGEKLAVSQAKLNNNNMVIKKISDDGGSGKALVDQIYAELQTAMAKVDAEIVKNESSITQPKSGETLTLEPLVLDLHALGMNSTLYEKIVSGDIEKIASYPGIESEDGYLYLKDGDAKFLIGKIAPVTFSDKTQLKPEGDSLYTLSDKKITPVYVENMSIVKGGYLENSNVDISEQLVDLLVYQKAFEANSKSISTSDEMIKTALALKTK